MMDFKGHRVEKGIILLSVVPSSPNTQTQRLPVIVIEPHPDKFPASAGDIARFTDELLQLGEANPMTAGILTVLFHRSLPVDVCHNVKISRDKLAAWAVEHLQ
jgi:hypothetical protein